MTTPPPEPVTPATPPPPDLRRQVRRAFGLLTAMTAATFGGPVGIWAVLRGGQSPTWPPDRPVEWATLFGISGCVLALLCLAVAMAVATQRAGRRGAAAPRGGPGGS